VKWGPLIKEAYDDIIDSVGDLTDSATRELKYQTPENMWEGRGLKRDVWDYYYLNYSEEFDPLILTRAAFRE